MNGTFSKVSILYGALASIYTAILLLFCVQYVLAQQETLQNITSLANKSGTSLFEGEAIKIIAFKSFTRENEWIPIDNYTSNGYEIKSIVPYDNRFYVILERETD